MSKTIYLSSINILRERIERDSELIQVLLGPRQVGKTTTVLKLINESYKYNSSYVSADGVFNADPSWLRGQRYIPQSQNKILFIDEIQKVLTERLTGR